MTVDEKNLPFARDVKPFWKGSSNHQQSTIYTYIYVFSYLIHVLLPVSPVEDPTELPTSAAEEPVPDLVREASGS